MTTVIDHAIAIPTRPGAVWQVISDISNLPDWHPDSLRVQYLTTNKSGRGTRWRNTTGSNRDQIFEITAWYERLGYEYRIVDGSSYPKNRGRIRLQEAPEGTIVQWTFSYEMNGFMGNLRNKLSMKGRADKEVVQGLRNLYTLIKETKLDEVLDPEQSKAYLKEAPNVEERASYQPKYPTKVSSQEIPLVEADVNQQFKPPADTGKVSQPAMLMPQIQEPSVTDEDTRPNPIVQQVNEAPPAPQITEPDFLKAMPESEPNPPATKSLGYPEPETASVPEIGSIGETETVDVKPLTPDTEKESNKVQTTVEPLTLGHDTGKLDTSTISVFELFGLEKPSETENVPVLSEELINEAPPVVESPVSEPVISFMDSAPIIPDITPEIPLRRRGLRATLRSRFTKVRVPRSD